MSSSLIRILIEVFLLVIAFITGYWLNKMGKPYSRIVFSIHKFTGLAAAVLPIVAAIKLNKTIPLTEIEIVFASICTLFSIGALITGGLLSAEKEMPGIVAVIHKISSCIVVVSAAILLYLL